MRTGVFAAILLGLIGVATILAQAQSQQPAPTDQMNGMDMSAPSSKPGGSGKPMDMSQCPMMHGAMHQGDATSIPPGAIRASFGDKSMDWTPAKLAALPHTTVSVYNEHTKANETYAGVPLIDLLTPLGVAEKPHGKDLRLFVLAAGSDGYEVVYSIGEVTPFINDSTVIVADSESGKTLTDLGPLELIATGEKHPARWVRNLVVIRVLAAE